MGEIRADSALLLHIGVENIVNDLADVLEYFAVGAVILVVQRRRGDIEIIAATAVKLGEYAVQRKGYLRIDVRSYSLLGPCRIYLARGNVFDLLGKRHGDILRV